MGEIQKETYTSLGVGLQSTILSIMILNKDERVKDYWDSKFIFSDTGCEEDHTYDYLKKVLKPYFNKFDNEIIVVKNGLGLLLDFMQNQKVMLGWVSPLCSSWSKRDNIRKYYRETHGITNSSGNKYLHKKFIQITELIGITMDEILRAKASDVGWLDRKYPLIDLNLERNDLYKIYEEYDIKAPKKSGCWLCPNKGKTHFMELKKSHPQRFELLRQMELNAERRARHDNRIPPTFIYKFKLENFNNQSSLEEWFGDQMCDSGYCMT